MRDPVSAGAEPAMDPQHPIDPHPDERCTVTGGVPPVVRGMPLGAPPGCLSPQVAELLLDTGTQNGDVVVDDVAFAAAAGRRHHALAGAQHLAVLHGVGGYVDLI